MPEKAARERFVEAQRKMWEVLCEYRSLGYNITHKAWMRAAVEAFADAECGVSDTECCKKRHIACNCHALACRASLLRDCGLGG